MGGKLVTQGKHLILTKNVTILFLLLLCVVPAHAQNTCTPADGTPITLGAIFPAGAPLTQRNSVALQGAEAMRQTINACGGVDGRPVEFILEVARDREDAAAAAQTLVDAGVPMILGSGGAAVSEGARPIAAAAGVVYWEMTEPLDNAGMWTFSPRPTNRQLGMAAVDFARTSLRESLGVESADELRFALVYESGNRGTQIANGVRDALNRDITLEFSYDEFRGARELAVDIRDREIDVLILSMFDRDAEDLWYQLREADANVDAWIHVGSQGYRRELCDRGGNIQAFISVDAVGSVNDDYRRDTSGDLYQRYSRVYLNVYGTQPEPAADLSASGVHLLLHYVLPNVEGETTSQNIREAILSQPLRELPYIGLMGEGLTFFDAENPVNAEASPIIRQQQGSFFCTVYPQRIATCSSENVIPFPTWRERALMERSNSICEGTGA